MPVGGQKDLKLVLTAVPARRSRRPVPETFRCVDQWNDYKNHTTMPHMASQRTVSLRGYGRKVNDGDQFYVIQ